MFWNKPPAPAPAPAPADSSSISTSRINRRVHLSSYLEHPILKPSTRKVSNDDTIYDTVFQTTNGFALIIRVYLPVDTTRAPSMTLHGVRASHNWLDIRMKVIGYAPISSDQRWASSNLKLGDAVYAVIHHFQLTPPSILDITDTNLKRLQKTLSPPTRPTPGTANMRPSGPSEAPNNPTMGGKNYETPTVEKKVNYDVEDYEVDALIPPVPSSFLKIDNMPLSELQQILDDKTTLQSFIDETSEVKTLKELKQSIETANVHSAEANLAHEEKIEGLCAEVETLKQDLNSKIEQYRKLDAERVAMTHPPDLQDAIKELNKAKKDAYRESEALGNQWVESGGENVSDFVKEFMEVRLLYHTRAAKAERLENSM